jgi:hypothetical protein
MAAESVTADAGDLGPDENRMNELRELYEAAYREHGDSHCSVLWPKGRQEERFHALTRNIRSSGAFSLLDYGCGLAHLKGFLDSRFENVSYTGADVVNAFVETNRNKYPDASFHHVQSPDAVTGQYDYVVCSGAFNILYASDPAVHQTIVFGMLEQLLARARVYVSVNMMTDAVDFQQPGSYHQNVMKLYQFAAGKLSRRLMLDQSYMPYEFTLTVWKEQRILRPANVYAND